MIIALDTSTPLCKLWIIDESATHTYKWEAGRQLADGLIGFLRARLDELGLGWRDITGIVVYKGPGSFTGLRIGLTVLNTIADSEQVPIVGETGDHWLERAIERLRAGENEKLVMPLYGREPNITTSRK